MMAMMGWLMAGAILMTQAAPEVRQVAPGVHVLMGTSGNVVIAPMADGVLIVDSERPGDVAEIKAAVRQVSPLPIRMIVNTHWHLDHSGGNEGLRDLGVLIVAQRNVCVRRSVDQFMPAYNRTIPAASPLGMPNMLFDRRMTLLTEPDRVTLIHAPAAHTDGDTIVRFAHANVIHMGDLYFNGIWPFIDRASGGSVQGLIRAIDWVLRMADAKTVIVPAHGEISDRAGLVRYRAMLSDVAAQVRQRVAAGETLAQVVAAKPAAGWRAGMEGNEDGFVGAVFDSYANPTIRAPKPVGMPCGRLPSGREFFSGAVR